MIGYAVVAEARVWFEQNGFLTYRLLCYVSVTRHSHLAASNVLMSSLGWWSWVLLLLILVVTLLTSGRKVNSY